MWGKQKFSQKPYLILLILIMGVSIGSASALVVHNENTRVIGNFKVDGTFEVDRTGTTSGITVQNDGFANVIKFFKTTTGNQQIFQFRQNAAGDTLDIIDITNNKIILSGKAGTGNVGIGGQTNPQEKLDVSGNVKADTYFDNGNTQTGTDASALGGDGNTASGKQSTVGGGLQNIASGDQSTVGGGQENTASGIDSTVGGGELNTASELQSTVGGGAGNVASGFRSTVPGGSENEASGDHSFAAGRRAHAIDDGAFVWAGSSTVDFSSTANDQFSIKASGGTRIFSAGDLSKGVLLLPGTNVWAAPSDYRLKDNISEYSVLDKLDDYRAVEFDWKAGGNHDVGVMAQELQSIFPELVNTGSTQGDITNAADPGVWSVQYSKLGALALQAIKEQQTIIDSLISIICEDNPDREICLEN